MNTRDEVIVYSTNAITSWQQELSEIPGKIEAQENIVKYQLPIIESLEKTRYPIQARISTLETNLLLLQGQARDDGRARTHCDHQPGIIGLGLDIANSISSQNQMSSIRKEISKLSDQKAALDRQIFQHQKEVNEANAIIERLTARRELIDKHYLAEAPVFLTKLKEAPETLFRELLDYAEKSLTQYHEETFEKNASVRLCLYNMEEKLNQILKDKSENDFNPIYEDYLSSVKKDQDKKEWQLKYLQLCGFLWDLYYQAQDDKDFSFARTILNVLLKAHIADNGSLPDNLLGSGNDCMAQFNLLKNKYPMIYTMDEKAFKRMEDEEYDKALNKLYEFASQGKKVKHKLAERLHDDVQAEVKRTPALKYVYTNVLQQGLDYYTCDQESKKGKEIKLKFAGLADRVGGLPSNPKKVFGTMSAIVGVTILTLSIAFAVPSFGGSSIGIFIGAGILAESLCVGAGVLGLGLTGLGMGLFASGMRKGVSKQIHQSVTSSEKIKKEDPRPSTSPAFSFCGT